MTPVEIDFMNNSTLFSVFFLGMFIGATLSTLVQIYTTNQRRKYKDRE